MDKADHEKHRIQFSYNYTVKPLCYWNQGDNKHAKRALL